MYIPKTISSPNLNIKLSKLEPLPLRQSFDLKHKGKHIKISPDGKIATGDWMYGGYSVISPKPLISMIPNESWFWVAILNTGIWVGVSIEDIDPKRLVGDDRNSWAIASNGKVIHDGNVFNYTTELFSGDVIEVILERKNRKLRFLVNGKEYGEPFDDPRLETLTLYPAVSVLPGASVKFLD